MFLCLHVCCLLVCLLAQDCSESRVMVLCLSSPSGVQRGRDGQVLHRCESGGSEELDDVHQVREERAGAEPGGGSDRQQHLLQGCGGQ